MIKNIIMFFFLTSLIFCDIKTTLLRTTASSTKKAETSSVHTNGHHSNGHHTTYSTNKEEENIKNNHDETHKNKEKTNFFKSNSNSFLVNEIKMEDGVINVVDANNALACFENTCTKIKNYRVYYKHKYPCNAKFLPIYFEMPNEDGDLETAIAYLKQNLGGELETAQKFGDFCQQIKR